MIQDINLTEEVKASVSEKEWLALSEETGKPVDTLVAELAKDLENFDYSILEDTEIQQSDFYDISEELLPANTLESANKTKRIKFKQSISAKIVKLVIGIDLSFTSITKWHIKLKIGTQMASFIPKWARKAINTEYNWELNPRKLEHSFERSTYLIGTYLGFKAAIDHVKANKYKLGFAFKFKIRVIKKTWTINPSIHFPFSM